MDTTIETRVISKLLPDKKVYVSTVGELYEEDQGITSELYQIKIFNHILNIAPGMVIDDETIPNLSYCYAYAVKNDRVICKLGVYESLSPDAPRMFDLSLFDEGSLLLFDIYSSDPSRILELEVPEATKDMGRVFDYIVKNVIPKKPPKDEVRNMLDAQVKMFNVLKNIVKESKEGSGLSDLKSVIKLLAVVTLYSDKEMKKLEEFSVINDEMDKDKLASSLVVLEPFFKVRFIIVTSKDELYDDSKFRRILKHEYPYETVVIVRTDGSVLNRIKADSLPEPYAEMLQESDRRVLEAPKQSKFVKKVKPSVEESTVFPLASEVLVAEAPIAEEPVEEASTTEATVAEAPIAAPVTEEPPKKSKFIKKGQPVEPVQAEPDISQPKPPSKFVKKIQTVEPTTEAAEALPPQEPNPSKFVNKTKSIVEIPETVQEQAEPKESTQETPSFKEAGYKASKKIQLKPTISLKKNSKD